MVEYNYSHLQEVCCYYTRAGGQLQELWQMQDFTTWLVHALCFYVHTHTRTHTHTHTRTHTHARTHTHTHTHTDTPVQCQSISEHYEGR